MVKSKIIGKLLKAKYLHHSKKRQNNAAADQYLPETPRGHFAVFSVNPEEEPQRFVVELQWLTHPSFLKLLKQAEDEFGFRQEGVLEFPCRAEELEKVLATSAFAV